MATQWVREATTSHVHILTMINLSLRRNMAAQVGDKVGARPLMYVHPETSISEAFQQLENTMTSVMLQLYRFLIVLMDNITTKTKNLNEAKNRTRDCKNTWEMTEIIHQVTDGTRLTGRCWVSDTATTWQNKINDWLLKWWHEDVTFPALLLPRGRPLVAHSQLPTEHLGGGAFRDLRREQEAAWMGLDQEQRWSQEEEKTSRWS